MQIKLKLMGMLKDKSPTGDKLELKDDATIRDAILALEIDVESVHVFTVNGKLVRDKEYSLSECDEFSIFPPVAGG